jgi:hypothetical protein
MNKRITLLSAAAALAALPLTLALPGLNAAQAATATKPPVAPRSSSTRTPLPQATITAAPGAQRRGDVTPKVRVSAIPRNKVSAAAALTGSASTSARSLQQRSQKSSASTSVGAVKFPAVKSPGDSARVTARVKSPGVASLGLKWN